MIDIRILEKSVDGKVVLEVLHELAKGEIGLPEIIIINKSVIPIYPSLPQETRMILISLISKSMMFLGQLIAFTTSIPNDQPEGKIYKRVLKDLLLTADDCLKNCLTHYTSTRTDQQTLRAIFFGSKLFNVLAPAVDINWYLDRLVSQWTHVLDMPLGFFNGSKFGQYIVAMLNLHPVVTTELLFRGLFLSSTSSLKAFGAMLSTANPLDQQVIMNNYFMTYLALHTNISNYRHVYQLLKEFPHMKMMNLQTIFKLKSPLLQYILIYLLEESAFPKLTSEMLNKFTNVDDLHDENVCQLLVFSLHTRMNRKEREAISHDPQFLNAITERLKNQDNVIRERTMFIAKLATDGELEYESDFTIEIPNLEFTKGEGLVDEEALIAITRSSFADQATSVSSSITELHLREDSDDDDDDDDDCVVGQREIVFIKDLVTAYETVDKNSSTNIVPLFKLTVRIVRQKKHLPMEVSFYSASLMSIVATSNNNYEEAKFEEWRINALVSIIVTIPEKVSDLLKILFNRELSLQQRMSILTALGLSARELKGHDDTSISKPEFDFPTKRLPWDKGASKIEEGPLVEKNSLISPGTTVWKSRKLQPKSASRALRKNLFKAHAAKFFYPLAHAWLNGIDLGPYDQLFKTHYLTTMTIVYQCAFPAHDYDSMTQLMNRIIPEALQQGLQLPSGITDAVSD